VRVAAPAAPLLRDGHATEASRLLESGLTPALDAQMFRKQKKRPSGLSRRLTYSRCA
jgi:hypothetical protein